MNIIKKIKAHVATMVQVRRLHGIQAVIGVYLSKIPGVPRLFRFLFGGWRIRTTILGSTMYLDVFDRGLHRKLLLKGIRERMHVEQVRRAVKNGMTGIELGANIGYYALLESQLVGPEGKIICIEPDPTNLFWLRRHIKENGFKNLETHQYLVGDHDGMEKLYLSEFANVHSISPTRGTRGSVDVPMWTLDTCIAERGLRPEDISFVRMDIEGYEVKAFLGMQRFLQARHPMHILIEFHPDYYEEWGWTFRQLLEFLKDSGFIIREVALDRYPDGRPGPVLLRNPTIAEVTDSPIFGKGLGSQAWLERIASQ